MSTETQNSTSQLLEEVIQSIYSGMPSQADDLRIKILTIINNHKSETEKAHMLIQFAHDDAGISKELKAQLKEHLDVK